MTPPRRHPADAYITRLGSAESRRTMLGCLRTLAKMLDGDDATEYTVAWDQVGYERASSLREQCTAGDWSPSTINKHLSALRGVVRECWRLGLIDVETAQRVREIESVTASRVAAGRALTPDEIEALLYACQDGSTKGARDAAIIAVLALTGGRRAELSALDLVHWVPAERALLYHGKGDKERVVHLATDALPYLSAWLRVRGTRPGPLFTPVLKSGRVITERRLSGQAVGRMLGRRGVEAGIPHATPHDLRRTFAGDLLDAGVDLSAVSRAMGHSSTDTTVRYDRRPLATQRAATDRLTLPPPRSSANPPAGSES